MKQLENAGRLIRFFDKDWNPKGHLFADIPQYGHLTDEIVLTLPLSALDFLDDEDVRYVVLPRSPRPWAIKGFLFSGDVNGEVILNLVNHTRFIESLMVSPEMYLAGSKILGVSYWI